MSKIQKYKQNHQIMSKDRKVKTAAPSAATAVTVTSSTTASTDETIRNEIKRLKVTFETGKTLSYDWRIQQLKAIKSLFIENETIISQALACDLGRSQFEAVGLEILPGVMEIDYVINNLKEWMKPVYTPIPAFMLPGTSEYVHEPYGVCLIIGAFNYPLGLLLGPLVGAIMTGNVSILKPSEMAVKCESLLTDLLPKYLDTSCYSLITGGVDTTASLLKERYDKIFFTGSPRVGKIVMKAAAEHLTPVSLELGM